MGEGGDARGRIEAAAYGLFAQRGIRATGIDDILGGAPAGDAPRT